MYNVDLLQLIYIQMIRIMLYGKKGNFSKVKKIPTSFVFPFGSQLMLEDYSISLTFP